MGAERKILEKAMERALSGKGAHVEAKRVFEGLNWKVAGARPNGVPHSVFQLLNHITYWQEWGVKWLDGEKPPIPRHASGSWPGEAAPAGAQEWKQAIGRFEKGLDEITRQSRHADPLTKRGAKTRLEMLHTIASHSSYHLGQVVQLRQMLGAWPPPSGGLTW